MGRDNCKLIPGRLHLHKADLILLPRHGNEESQVPGELSLNFIAILRLLQILRPQEGLYPDVGLR